MAVYLLILFAFIFPVVVTVFEVAAFFVELFRTSGKEKYATWFSKHPKIVRKSERYSRIGFVVEIPLYLLCFFFEFAFMELLLNVYWDSDWTKQLYNNQRHQPIAPEYLPGVIAIIIIYLLGLTVAYVTKTNKTPPLVTALSISALYLGVIYSVIWTIHISPVLISGAFYLLILPINSILISARLIIKKVAEYEVDSDHISKIDANPLLSKIYRICAQISKERTTSEYRQAKMFLPLVGLILLIPLIGIMVIILLMFGQAPDAAIKAFTETSDFILSTKVSPQNLIADEHYLCTVAAGGDRKIVKPLRKGLRHGHEVTVNRQLQVANAFEEVIMVKTPAFHRHLRHFYDTYGFPVAKLIKKSWVADMVYFIMKPLEYLFVIVLYLTEVHPEDRISLQYTGTTLERFKNRSFMG